MIFFYNGRDYAGTTAVEIVCQMARDTQVGSLKGGSLRDYLCRSLVDLSDRIHMRELDTSSHLSDETLAFNYLCLLDEYDNGCLDASSEGRTWNRV